jgi:hypothetical protein
MTQAVTPQDGGWNVVKSGFVPSHVACNGLLQNLRTITVGGDCWTCQSGNKCNDQAELDYLSGYKS